MALTRILGSIGHCLLSYHHIHYSILVMEKASGDDIADVVLKQFHALPKKAKPIDRGGGTKEWVPLSGIVAQGWTFKTRKAEE